MNPDLLRLLLLGSAFLALFGLAEILYHKARVPAELTRKLVHSGTGLLTLLFPLVLDQFWQVAVLCAAFLVLLLASLAGRFLPSINAVARDTLGSVLYPITVAGIFLFYQHAMTVRTPLHPLWYFYLPVLIMALCDPLAAAVGQRIAARQPQRYGARKTVQGSAAFFAGAVLLTGIALLTSPGLGSAGRAAGLVVVTALATTAAERWSQRGWDNLTIPATAAAVLWGFQTIGL